MPGLTRGQTRGWAVSGNALGPPWPDPIPTIRGPIICSLHFIFRAAPHLAAMLSALLRPGMPHSRR